MKYLSDYTNEKQTQAFDEAGAFFAFSQKQFNEAKKEGVAQDIQENGKKAIIRRELFNHECFYTGDITGCVEKLEDYDYSYDDIYQVYRHICQTEDVH